jgi:hypothetical protein
LLFVTIIINIVIIFSLFFFSEGGCFLQQPQPPRFKPRNFRFQ